MDDAMLLPASDSSLAWVYEGATPAMTADEAATAIRAATIGWTQDDHLQMGALQHHLAVALCDDPERQAVCSAAAYMHVAAAGLNPGSLLGKGMDPKVLRPKLGTKPVRIGTTRSNKPIYNMFDHPAHTTFKTADHVDHIKAMEAHNKEKKMSKSGGEGSRGGKILRHTAAGVPVYAPSGHNGFSIGKTESGIPVHHDGSHLDMKSKKDFVDASRLHGAKAAYHRQKAAKITEARQGNIKPSSALSAHKRLMNEHERHSQQFNNLAKMTKSQAPEGVMHKSEAVSILEDFLVKSGDGSPTTPGGKLILPHSHSIYGSKTFSSGSSPSKAGNARLKATTLKQFPSYSAADHAAAGAHHVRMAEVHGMGISRKNYNIGMGHKMAAEHLNATKKSMSKSGEGSRGGKVIGHTKGSNKPIYAHSASHASFASFSRDEHVDARKKHAIARDNAFGNAREHQASGNLPAAAKAKAIGNHHSAMYEAHFDAQMKAKKSMSKSGEGSRGGKVIGHTKGSNKPIYAHSASHSSFSSFSRDEHVDARKKHAIARDNAFGNARDHQANGNLPAAAKAKAIGNHHSAMHEAHFDAQMKANKSMSKSGEGSRGGKVIGHTKGSNRPIYATHGPAHADYKGFTAADHSEAAAMHGLKAMNAYKKMHMAKTEEASAKYHSLGLNHQGAAILHSEHAARGDAKKSMSKSDIMGVPVDLGDTQGSPIDGSYVDSMGGSHDLFMQQAELANCPTMWAPIATVPEN